MHFIKLKKQLHPYILLEVFFDSRRFLRNLLTNRCMANLKYKLTGTILIETTKALQMQVEKIDDNEIDTRTEWFPFSQVSKITKDSKVVGADTIEINGWILEQKDML